MNPAGFLGAHVLQLFSFPSGDPAEFERMGPEDYAALEFAGWFQTVNGFVQMNASRPQTIAAALSDSPVGQLAYNELFENFGNGTSLLSRDQVLTQVSLYWLTNTSAGAVRYYYEEKAVEPSVNGTGANWCPRARTLEPDGVPVDPRNSPITAGDEHRRNPSTRRTPMTAQPIAPRPRQNAGDDMLTLQEACRFLRVPEGTLRYWRHLGCGPRSFKVGRHVRYWRTDLVLWLTEQTNRPQERA